jgi:hypothetical protein
MRLVRETLEVEQLICTAVGGKQHLAYSSRRGHGSANSLNGREAYGGYTARAYTALDGDAETCGFSVGYGNGGGVGEGVLYTMATTETRGKEMHLWI